MQPLSISAVAGRSTSENASDTPFASGDRELGVCMGTRFLWGGGA